MNAGESGLPAASLFEEKKQENGDSICAQQRLLQGPLEQPSADSKLTGPRRKSALLSCP